MLILSRKQNEQIVIRGNIVVTVIAISGNHVRLGVEAPRQIPVNREEVLRTPKEKRAGELPAKPPAGNGDKSSDSRVQLSLPFPEA